MSEWEKYDYTYTVVQGKQVSSFYIITKRALDLAFSVIGLCIFPPIIITCCLLIMIESPGSPFFLQERLGLNGKKFRIVKLRSMRLDAEKNGAQWAAKHDDRITRIGALMRKTRIDELPQLFNVLKGDMSFIGPRPERPFFANEFERSVPGFQHRLVVKPGLTGWAQVNGGYDITPKQKLELDMYYIRNASLLLDCIIICKTIKVILTGEGAR